MRLSQSAVKSLVWIDDERRPTALVRLVLTTLLVGLVVMALVVALQGLDAMVDGLPEGAAPIIDVAFAGAFGVTVVLAALLIDRRTLPDLGIAVDRQWWSEFGFGLALASGLVLGIFFVLSLAGWIRITGTVATSPDAALPGFLPNFAVLLGLFLLVGIAEELLFRGYLLTNVAEGLTSFDRVTPRTAVLGAAGVSALLFGLGHAGNPTATAVSTAGLVAAGVLYVTGYVLTGRLAIPIGFHIAWNIVEGAVLGFPVSGNRFDASVIAVAERGPDLATGGAFGPEASIVGIAARVLGILAIVGYVWHTTGSSGVVDAIAEPTLRWRTAGCVEDSTRHDDTVPE